MRHSLYVMAFAFALSAPVWAQDGAMELAQARQAVDKAVKLSLPDHPIHVAFEVRWWHAIGVEREVLVEQV
ncbi:hypothetical protein BMR86_23260, partial [Stenotrophomonas sp. KAs 5-3]